MESSQQPSWDQKDSCDQKDTPVTPVPVPGASPAPAAYENLPAPLAKNQVPVSPQASSPSPGTPPLAPANDFVPKQPYPTGPEGTFWNTLL